MCEKINFEDLIMRKRHVRASVAGPLCALLVLGAIISSAVVSVTLSPSTPANATEQVLVVAEGTIVPPEIQWAGFQVQNFTGGMALAYNGSGVLHYFHGKDSGDRIMAALNTSDPSSIVTGPNLLPTNQWPAGIDRVSAATFIPEEDVFLVATTDCDFFKMTPDGSAATPFNNGPGTCPSDLTYVEGIVYSVGHGEDLYAINATDGTEIFGVGLSHQDFSSEIIVSAISFDPTTELFLVWYRVSDSLTGPGFTFTETTLDQTFLGTINVTSGIVQSTLFSEPQQAVSAFAFAENGEAFFGVGGRHEYPYRIYHLSYSPVPKNVQQGDFTLQCEPDYTGNLEDEYTNTYTVNGMGCGDVLVYDATPLPTATVLSRRSTMVDSNSSEPVNSTALCLEVDLVLMNVTNPHNITNGTVEARDLAPAHPYPGYTRIEGAAFACAPGDQAVSLGATVADIYTLRGVIGTPFPCTITPDLIVTNLNTHMDITAGAPVPCDTADTQREMIWDSDLQRMVYFWVTTGLDRLCMAISTTSDPMGTLDYYSFDLSGQQVAKLDISRWSDVYTACWNNGTIESTCYVIERNVFVIGFGTPRMLALPRPSIVATDGSRATSVPLERSYNDCPLTTVMSAYPCGIFVALTADNGGVLNLVLCQSIDFDGMTVTTIDSRSTIGTYNNGALGSCASETECIPTASLNLDPARYDLKASFLQNELVIGIVVDADGTSTSKFLFANYEIQTGGTLLELNSPSTVELYPGQHHFSLAMAQTMRNTLLIDFWHCEPGAIRCQFSKGHTLSSRSRFDFAFEPQHPSSGSVPAYTGAHRRQINLVPNLPRHFVSVQTEQFAGQSFYNALYRISNQTVVRRFLAYDKCNRTATCARTVSLGLVNYTVPIC